MSDAPQPNADIVLTAINARYTHSSLGSRYLLANLGELRKSTMLLEFNINQSIDDMLAAIAIHTPRIIAIGIYIWNRTLVEALLPRLRETQPQARIVLGGPELTHDLDSRLASQADVVVCGEADQTFAQICRDLLAGKRVDPIVAASPPDLTKLALPYHEFSPHDLAHRAIYVESSRGCPHHCAFCLSALDSGVRHLDEAPFHEAITQLLDAGVRNLRFVDRSFNLGGARACRLLDLLLARTHDTPFCVHLELTPDELNAAIRERLAQFPAGALHVEVGIQTLDPAVAARIGRPMDPERVGEGVRFLTKQTQAAVHADLIAGLPGETPTSFAAGFDQLYTWNPHEIQVGILKGLRGTPILEQTHTAGLHFSPTPPYNILDTATMPAAFINTVKRFAAHWERVVNRKHLPTTMAHMLHQAESPWECFNAFSQQLDAAHGHYGIDLLDICKALLAFIPTHTSLTHAKTQELLRADYHANPNRIATPTFLRSVKKD